MTGFEVREVKTREELDALIHVEWASYHSPYRTEYQFLHPVFGPTDEDRERSFKFDQDRLWEKHIHDPASHWIYVIDTRTSEVLGGAEWLFYTSNPFPDGPKPLEATWWPPGVGRDFTSEMIRQMYLPRQAWMQRPFAGLNAMAVHPDHRRRGVGTTIVKWGLQRADELGLESLVESSDAGCLLYESFGYRRMLTIAISMSKKAASDAWKAYKAHLGVPIIHVMWRPARGLWDGGRSAPWESR